MTIEELLQELKVRWGKGWYIVAMRRLLILSAISPLTLTNSEAQEYCLLDKWALEMIEAGIASKQSQEQPVSGNIP